MYYIWVSRCFNRFCWQNYAFSIELPLHFSWKINWPGFHFWVRWSKHTAPISSTEGSLKSEQNSWSTYLRTLKITPNRQIEEEHENSKDHQMMVSLSFLSSGIYRLEFSAVWNLKVSISTTEGAPGDASSSGWMNRKVVSKHTHTEWNFPIILYFFSVLLCLSPQTILGIRSTSGKESWLEPKTLRKENHPLWSNNMWSQKHSKNLHFFLSPSVLPWLVPDISAVAQRVQ